jgi:hypothetical protein
MDPLLLLSVLGAIAAFVLAFGGERPWQPRLRGLLHGLAAVGAVVAIGRFAWFVVGWLPADSPANSYDFRVFYEAALVAREWGPLYDLAGIRRDPGTIVVYRHAPIGAGLFVPWTLLPYGVALNGWRLLNVGLYAWTLWTLLRHFGLSPRAPLALGLTTLWFASTPSRDSLALGQWDALFLNLGLAATILYTTRRDRDPLVGALLALPIALKFYPALLLIGPVVARRWRVLAGCAAGGMALGLLGLLLAGPRNTIVFLAEVAPAVGGGTLYAENQTLYALIGRFLAADLPGNGVGATYSHELTRLLARALAAPILAVTALVAWRRGGGELAAALRFVLPIPAALLIVPTAWAHYSAWALLPLAILAIALARGRPGRATLALFAVAALLIVLGSERDVWRGGPHDGPIRLLLTFKAYGLLALWVALCLVGWRTKPESYAGPERRRPSLLFGRVSGW